MLQRIEMDEHVPLADQLANEVGPVTLINTFKVAPEDADTLLEAWAADAAYLKTKPVFISTQRLRGSAVPGDLRPLSGLDRGLTASVPEGGRARHLRGPLARRRQDRWPPMTAATIRSGSSASPPGSAERQATERRGPDRP